jgi:hypothetical protein
MDQDQSLEVGHCTREQKNVRVTINWQDNTNACFFF